nr:uncharacterized protein [Candida metapsilosis]
MQSKIQLFGVLSVIIAIVHAATIHIVDVVHVTVSRSAIYNESGVFYTEYLLGNPSSTSISTTTSEVYSSISSSVEQVQLTSTPVPSSSTLATTRTSSSSVVVASTSTSIIPPPPAPVTTKSSSSKPKPSATTKAQNKTTTKATPSPTPKATSSDSSFTNAILSAHNVKRAAHGVPALSWSQELYNYAQNVANSYDCSGNLKHTSSPYGENLGVGYSSAQSVVNAWYAEGKNYNYQSATTFDHFTQVVWKSTTQLGCAYKDCSAKGWGMYVICNYKEVGNMKGQGRQNVLPLV